MVGDYLEERLKENSVRGARRRLRRKTEIRYIEEEDEVEKDQYKWTEIERRKGTVRGVDAYIYGLKVEIKGRISKKRRIRRSNKKGLRIGRLEYNTISNIIDYYQIESIGVQGVYNIRVGMSTRLERRGDLTYKGKYPNCNRKRRVRIS